MQRVQPSKHPTMKLSTPRSFNGQSIDGNRGIAWSRELYTDWDGITVTHTYVHLHAECTFGIHHIGLCF